MAKTGRRAYLSSGQDEKENGVAIFAPAHAEPVALACLPEDSRRIVACRFDGILLVGVYFAQNRAKLSLFEFLLSKPFHDTSVIVMGDFNTGLHRIDEVGATFHCANEFSRLPSAGLHDLWRHHVGEDARDYSWFSNAGNPFRIDHAFGSEAIVPRVQECRYDHSVRGSLSDHAALLLTVQGVA